MLSSVAPLDLHDTYSYHIPMMNRLGALIKRRRTPQGLSKRALGAQAGLTNSYIAQLETGQRGNPTVLVAMRLADALGVSVMDLITCAVTDERQTTLNRRPR